MIKNIVLDMGGVCCRWDPVYLSKKLSDDPTTQLAIREYVFSSEEWTLADKGVISLEEAKTRIVSKTPIEYKEIAAYSFDHWHDYFDQIEGMQEVVEDYKEKGFTFYLLSNCSKQFYDYYNKRPIFKLLKSLYISADVQLLKPSVEIFEDFCNKNQLDITTCCFVDDTKANVEGAIKAGMKGYHFNGDINKFRNYLDTLLGD